MGHTRKEKKVLRSGGVALVLFGHSFEVRRRISLRCLRAVLARLIVLLAVELGALTRAASMKPLPPRLICSEVQQGEYRLLHPVCRNNA